MNTSMYNHIERTKEKKAAVPLEVYAVPSPLLHCKSVGTCTQKSEEKRCSQSLERQRPFVRWEEPCRYDVTASHCDGSPAAIDVMGAISSGSRSTRLKAAGAQVLLPLLLLQLHDADLQRSISHGDGISLDTTARRFYSVSDHLDRLARARELRCRDVASYSSPLFSRCFSLISPSGGMWDALFWQQQSHPTTPHGF